MKIVWDQLTELEWEHLCDAALAPMAQRWTYGAVHETLGGRVHRAVIWMGGKPVALCQSLSRKFAGFLNAALASRGPVWLGTCDQTAALKMIRRTLPVPHPRTHIFSLTNPVSAFTILPMMSAATFAQCALPLAQRSLHGKWRNALKKAGKYNIIINKTTCSRGGLDLILETDFAQQKTKSYQALPAEFTRIWQAKAPKNLRLFSARKDGKLIASALFLHHGTTATYHIAHTSAKARQISAGHLLLWRAMQELSSKGVRQLDLGLIDTENAPGLARFKLGAGAEACKMGPTVLAL